MQVNHETTRQILTTLEDLVEPAKIEIQTENKDYFGEPSGSDYVVLEKTNHVGFEVFGDEIRVDFFDDHQHFGRNYTFEEDVEADVFVAEAVALLRRLLSETLVKIETYRGKKRVRHEWFFLLPDGRKDSIGGPWLKPLFTFVNPFRKKTYTQTRWRFHGETGTFVIIGDDTVSVHSYDWDIMIEIHRNNGVYSYNLHRYRFDEEEVVYYWVPIDSPGASFFDTENAALRNAREAAKTYCSANKDRSVF